MGTQQHVKRESLKNTSYLTELQALSGVGIDYALKYTKADFLSNSRLASLADCFSQNSKNSLFKKGNGYCIVGHVKNQNISGTYPEYFVFDTFREDGGVCDRDPILIPVDTNGKPIGYTYRMFHTANGLQWQNKHILKTDADNLSSLPQGAPAFDYRNVSIAVPGLSAEFSDPISALETQLSTVDAYWDKKTSNPEKRTIK